jgi:hypothetical protein
MIQSHSLQVLSFAGDGGAVDVTARTARTGAVGSKQRSNAASTASRRGEIGPALVLAAGRRAAEVARDVAMRSMGDRGWIITAGGEDRA